jgi:hypothetical protein
MEKSRKISVGKIILYGAICAVVGFIGLVYYARYAQYKHYENIKKQQIEAQRAQNKWVEGLTSKPKP